LQELAALKKGQIVLEALRMMETNQSQFYKSNYDAMQALLDKVPHDRSGELFCRALKIPDGREAFNGDFLANTVLKTLRMEAARRVIITVIALKRFELKHGKLPEKISEHAPEFLSAVPIDPFDGQPLRYRPNGDGTFLLYCVGEDGVDDGGDPSQTGTTTSSSFDWQNRRARDWVWPQPASALEIQTYYEDEAKKAK
jgi:hypothetical protein